MCLKFQPMKLDRNTASTDWWRTRQMHNLIQQCTFYPFAISICKKHELSVPHKVLSFATIHTHVASFICKVFYIPCKIAYFICEVCPQLVYVTFHWLPCVALTGFGPVHSMTCTVLCVVHKCITPVQCCTPHATCTYHEVFLYTAIAFIVTLTMYTWLLIM